MTKQNDLTNQEIADTLFVDEDEQNDELDKILDQHLGESSAIFMSLPGGSQILMPSSELKNISKKTKQQILDWHKRECERVIGKDELPFIIQPSYVLNIGTLARREEIKDEWARYSEVLQRDKLRAEQRKRMEEE